MANYKATGRAENLRTPTAKEARERGRAGGIASGEARRERATLLKWAMTLRDAPNPDCKGARDAEREGLTQGQAVVLAMYREARSGNVQAAKFLSDLMRETDAQPTVAAIHSPLQILFPTADRMAEIQRNRSERNARDERELNGK